MKRLCLISCLVITGNAHAADVSLFNGKDLTGWTETSRMPGKEYVLSDVWSVRDGMIMCHGGANLGNFAGLSHLHSDRAFDNFELSLEYKWGDIDPAIKAAGGNIYNSGVYFRSNPRTDPNGVFPFSYYTQIIHTPARSGGADRGTGDLSILGYSDPDFKAPQPAPAERSGSRALPPGYSASRTFKRLAFADKPIGEWNTFVIRMDHDKVTLTLNGVVINRGTGAVAHVGRIGLECENTPIFFRNIKINSLP